ncbi:DUF1439 domain-containing protein [Alteromonas sediminis]|uniref:DUF1439 domain-containing protein n=1 Tax=Alteromonas sediminis TaxID=2259342 RepID=A0A3N5Z823_9ALTE|nr:DUF1439 domain-containing protein [Alteromonas sediminis]RPJ65098.1 DUF1439 domain-containing protein [Alteromonas sediminis]
MKNLSFMDKCRFIGGWFLIKTGRLSFDAFTEDELNQLLAPYFPLQMHVEVPVGNAKLNCVEAEVSMPADVNELQLNLLTEFHVDVLGNPVYRAHILAVIKGTPHYDASTHTVEITDISLNTLALVHDEYSMVKDTSSLIQQLGPLAIAGSFTSPLKSIVNSVTGGLSNAALHYLQSFTQGNKQKLLEQHKPAIEKALKAKLHTIDTHFTMRDTHWREYLFSRFGDRVSVDDHLLKFWLS